MIGDILEIAAFLIGYLTVGLVIARTQAKRIYRQVQRNRNWTPSRRQDEYHSSLTGWVFLWPFRMLSVVLRFSIYHFLIHPAEVTVSWAADLVKAPVTGVLRDIEEAGEQAEECSRLLANPQASEDEKEIAQNARDQAYRRQQQLCEDLGIKAPMRTAISLYYNEEISRGVETARRVMSERDEHTSVTRSGLSRSC